jgi:hypothetical protein
MFFLVSVSSEVFHRIMTMRLLYRRLGINASATRDAPELLRGVRRSFGGRLVLVDWHRGKVLADRAIAGVSGLATQDRTVMACSWIDQCIYVLNGSAEVSTVTHPWFNYIHSVDLTPQRTILLASAGSDLIVEISSGGEVVWEWFGPEHGYGTCPEGTPVFFDRGADYRTMRRSTAEQAMHVTSAILLSNNTVLATLFHQGALVSIDRETGEVRVILDGLSRPHGVHRCEGGFILSDTLGHRILLLNEELQICSEIPFGSQWLQDTIISSSGTYLTLENVHIDQLPEPGLTNRLTEINERGRPLRQMDVGADFRLFTAREINEGFAHTLAQAWGRHGDFDGWRWKELS